MIFVTTGSAHFPFDRLISKIDLFAKKKIIADNFLVQLGRSNYQPGYCKWVTYLDFDEMCEYIKESRLVICHAGVGTLLLTLEVGKRPIMVPRLKKYGEAVDNHQLMFANKMQELDMAYSVTDLDNLESIICSCIGLGDFEITKNSGRCKLVEYLKEYIRTL